MPVNPSSRIVFIAILTFSLAVFSGCGKPDSGDLPLAKDPVFEEIYVFRTKIRQYYNNRQFDELEKRSAEIRKANTILGNGSWEIVQFYASLECLKSEPESMWQLHDQIHRDWIAANPESVVARVAYADFLTLYAWQARGSGYADTVTDGGWSKFEERINAAAEQLTLSRELEKKDIYWCRVAMRVAMAQGWSKADFEKLIDEAHSIAPKFWGCDVARAYSLLPRWHGEPGDWEAFAERTSERPDGLGAELYARIVLYQSDFFDNIFKESNATWPKTREGLEQMIQRYPDSIEIPSQAALIACIAEDREFAEKMFDRIGDQFLVSVWRKPEKFLSFQKWAKTGTW